MEQEPHLAPRPDLVPVEDVLHRRVLSQKGVRRQILGAGQGMRRQHQVEFRLRRSQPQP